MAVNLSRAELAESLGMAEGPKVGRLLAASKAIVEHYARSAPDAIQEEAVILLAGNLKDGHRGTLGQIDAGSVRLEFQPQQVRAAFRNSGAMGLLSPWKIRRAGAVGSGPAQTKRTTEETDIQPGGTMPSDVLPSVRLFLLTLANPGFVLSDLQNATAQQLLDRGLSGGDGVEIQAMTRRAISSAAPVECYQQVFELTASGLQWVAVAVADGSPLPSHFRLRDAYVTNSWNHLTPAIGTVLSRTWTQAPGQAVEGGVAHSLHFWPQAFFQFPEKTTFEWVLAEP